MDPDLAPWLDRLRAGGAVFEVDPDLARDADFEGPVVHGEDTVRQLVMEDMPPVIEHRDPAAGISADHATQSVAREMIRRPHVEPERPLWEIGCGTGVLAALGGLMGATPVLAVDVDPRALALAWRTASDSGVEVEPLRGSLLEPVPGDAEADLLVANLPHKPRRRLEDLPASEDGGPEGDAVFGSLVAQAERRLPPGARILFFLHSLPHPRLLARFSPCFDLRLLSWKRRYAAPGEWGGLLPWYGQRSREGTSWIGEADGRTFLACGVWEARRRGP